MPSHAPMLLAGGAIAAGIALYAMNTKSKKPQEAEQVSWDELIEENDWKTYVKMRIRAENLEQHV